MKAMAGITLVLMLTLSLLLGCGDDNGPISSSTVGGTGYKVVLSASNSSVRSGGTVALTAVAYDQDGKVILVDDDGITFQANAGGVTFDSSAKMKITGGAATTVMKYEDTSSTDNPDFSQACLVSASYRGALTSIEIVLVAKAF